MPKAISYVRYSSPKQSLGDSLRRQLDRTKEYCATHNLTLDETLRDEGLSAYTNEHVKHGALGRFLAAVEAGQVPRGTYLILEHLDRFSRQNTRVALTLLLNLINKGIRVVTLFNSQVYSDTSETIEHDLIGAILYMSEAHKASVRKADLLKEKWDGHRKQVASGQRKVLTHMRPAWLDVDAEGGFIANAKGKATVRRIFELIASGLSTYAVCQLLNDGNKPTPTLTGNKKSRETGKPLANGWNTARISEIVRSDAPLGWFQPHKREDNKKVKAGEPIKGYYPAVVSQTLADRARYQLTTRAFGGEGSGRSGATVTNLFSGLCKCVVCGATMYLYHHGMIGGIGRAKRFHNGYLRCSNNKRNMGCTNASSIPYLAFEKFIVELIGGFSIPDGEAGQPNKVTDQLAEQLAVAKADATQTYEAVKTLLDAFVANASPLVMARIAELEAKHAQLNKTVADLEKQIEMDRTKSQPSDEIEAVQRILSKVDSPDPQQRLLTRTRVAAGMRQFIRHFLCFPNRGIIAEYDLGGVMCVTRIWLAPDGEYEVYHTDWDWGQRNGKAWLPAKILDWQNYILDYDPNSQRSAYNRRRIVKAGDMIREGRGPDKGFRFTPKIADVAPEHLDLQPEDILPPR